MTHPPHTRGAKRPECCGFVSFPGKKFHEGLFSKWLCIIFYIIGITFLYHWEFDGIESFSLLEVYENLRDQLV